ncbi:PTS fructose transporter subunit IIABC [Saliterribacillus persicus]|uniref:PTS system D-fructose-specific IIA component (F1P-forming) (Frc family) /PTS system D-fructose-specific IIB component (F1P-forming) (Frc family) /PTS system D-fructose-specific IIC component (F1P-f... n=1 Tax=Saliterribacillus persicus TaxID=930114 RepID=A0A368Y9A2_9BACI|nr:fructose-specific PTS transporter subunit EIIC [Saliterribacillus persicus]RCW76850.1 PTS system D-fructose-specific IIA component (F1P-forming) (Frc family) /PTS system D-fructose-specific IIB component (F1P-forming) (Frc family) /PTS system D-fructose-specific IIC component (F1P-forming) (Frc family) [Saliterribacillus persicus]
MNITELLKQDTMILDLKATSKDAALSELADRLDSSGRLSDKEKFLEAIHEREGQSSTGVGDGVAIPHAKTSAVKTPAIAFARSHKGIDFDSLDQQPAHLFFMIAASEGANNDHLQTLSRLSTLLMDDDFRRQLLKATSKEEILSIVDQKEKEKLGKEEETTTASDGPEILAVTGCPTGIAHTYMAADALKEKAKELGVSIKVETNGSDGVKNRLTDEDIKNAKAIIIAADTKVETDRFAGKKVLNRGVQEGMRKPEELINQALKGDAPIHQASGEGSSSSSSSGRSGFYKHLMNGVSNMLPFVVGGGVLIAISFFFGINSANPDHESYNAFSGALSVIGGEHAFGLMVAVLAGFIGMSIADRPGFAPAMVGGFMAATGGAGFLGGLIAGFLGGYIVLLLKKIFKNLPQSLDGIKTILFYPVLGLFITGMLMHFVIIEPISLLMTFLENWLGGMTTTNAIILGVILGGMMAVDMGGPINKTAFTFGIAMIDAGNFGPHAAVMAGGMVPPLGLALATTLFKSKFTKEERDAGKTSYVLGSFFITEGAIPFAAADPGRVIPSIIVGSAIAGGLSLLFGVGLPAPHGGIFVIFGVQGSALLYILAILIGAIVSALMVGFWKKPLK